MTQDTAPKRHLVRTFLTKEEYSLKRLLQEQDDQSLSHHAVLIAYTKHGGDEFDEDSIPDIIRQAAEKAQADVNDDIYEDDTARWPIQAKTAVLAAAEAHWFPNEGGYWHGDAQAASDLLEHPDVKPLLQFPDGTGPYQTVEIPYSKASMERRTIADRINGAISLAGTVIDGLDEIAKDTAVDHQRRFMAHTLRDTLTQNKESMLDALTAMEAIFPKDSELLYSGKTTGNRTAE